jgi:hypothetical protein
VRHQQDVLRHHFLANDSIGHLVGGAISAHRKNVAAAGADRLLRQVGGVVTTLGLHDRVEHPGLVKGC